LRLEKPPTDNAGFAAVKTRFMEPFREKITV